ncbi:MAG TPA: methylated-DNA--[protein]-cysteine S-methyltransferase [Opitutaceae bacterium]|nr:methylated-DNA--[protein]-cysteine S-methyltransferase [Opitutaceae bacterium]
MNRAPTFHFTQFNTPMGGFSVAVDSAGAVAATAFGDADALLGRLRRAALVRDTRRTAAAREQIEAWFRGGRRDFSIEISPAGTAFQRRVWDATRRIPFGQTRSYGEVARIVGSSARAVGRANATNPICLIVPCHRVVGSDGSLTGYAFGQDTKRRLLDFEAAGGRPGHRFMALCTATTKALSFA